MNKPTAILKGLVAFAAITSTCNMNAEQSKRNDSTETSQAKETKHASDNVEQHSSTEVHKSKSAGAVKDDNKRTSFVFVGKVTGITSSANVLDVRTALKRVPGVSHVNIRPDASGGPAEVETTSTRANLSKDDITRSLKGTKQTYDVAELQVSKVKIKPASK